VRRVAFASSGERADLYIRTSLKRSPSGVMRLRLPMLIMRVEEVHAATPARVCVGRTSPRFEGAQAHQEEVSAEGHEHRREHHIGCAALFAPAHPPLSPRCDACLQTVFEKIGDLQPKYTVNLERCDLIKVSVRAYPHDSTNRHRRMQPEVATVRARELSREELGGSTFGLHSDLGCDFFFKSDNAEVRTARVLQTCCSHVALLQNFVLWLELFDNIVTNWKKLLSVVALSLPVLCPILLIFDNSFRLFST
jgi:hypothetical protein